MKKSNWQKGFLYLTAALLVLAGCASPEGTATPAVQEELAEFAPGVSATGVIVPQTHASLSVNTPGVVEAVFVAEGDVVAEGEVLLQIKGGEQARAAIAAAQLELIGAQNALQDLHDNAPLVSAAALKLAGDTEDALEDLLSSDLREAAALQAVAEAQKLVEDTDRVYQYTISTADQADIDLARAQVALAKDALDKAIEDYEPYEDKPEDNLIRASLLARKAAAQQAYDDAVRHLNALLGTGSEADIAVAHANLIAAQAQLVEARRTYERVMAGPAEGDIALLEAQIAKALRDYEDNRAGPDALTLAAAQARLANAEAQLAAAQAALADLQLLAPFDGTISELNINPSEWVSPGVPVIVIADLGNLLVETTDLSEIDVARIAAGDTVLVTFDALPDAIAGVVTSISPKAAPGSSVNYTVRIALEDLPAGLRWGMTAFVDVDADN
jgi:multidrug efflux pump subunit AcrA (membrane-fusion protein)